MIVENSSKKEIIPLRPHSCSRIFIPQPHRIRQRPGKRLSRLHPWRCTVIVTLIVLAIFTIPGRSQEVTRDSFSTANNSVNNAFSSVYSAEQSGGDVSPLVERLNMAIFLIQRASSENSTNPNAATMDLSNATSIAQGVSIAAVSASNSGSTARQLRLYESVGTIAATISLASLAYINGDSIYRRIWLYVYRSHLVRKKDE